MNWVFKKSTCKVLSLAVCCITTMPLICSAEDTALPECTSADVTAALGDSPSCDSTGVVFFGNDVGDFVTSQCAPLAVPNETDGAMKQAQVACIHCAKTAYEAFQAAARAKLIPGTKPSRQTFAKI